MMLLRIASVCLMSVLWCSGLSGQSRFDLHQVAWEMQPDPSGDSITMTMRLKPLVDRDRIVLRIPLWRPGSYRFANYQDEISELKAVDQNGTEREIQTLDPRTWQVRTQGATSLEVSYQLEVNNDAEPGRTPVIHLHGPASFLYLEDALELPHTLRFDLPSGWEHASGHRADMQDATLFRSPNYDVFVDCPIVLGDFEKHFFESHGKPFEIVIAGRTPNENQLPRQEWTRQCKAIAEASYELVGDYPFDRYVFLFIFNGIGGGYGLEHLNSTTIMWNYRNVSISGLSSITAHEFFHLWNVKRIRPHQLGPFDYKTDVHTNDLWWMEGVTEYYTDVILQRAGLRDDLPNWFWEAQARTYRSLRSQPGFGYLSPERSSWTIWNRQPSRSVSYYDQGKVLGFLLDVSIRRHTDNQRSLDDVVRFLHRWVNYPEPGYRPGDLERAIHAVTGWDCAEFFDKHVSGIIDPPYEEVLGPAGFTVIDSQSGSPFLGINLNSDKKISFPRGTSAPENGWQEGDELVRLDGKRIHSRADVRKIVEAKKPGDKLEAIVLRKNERIRVEVEMQERTRYIFQIKPDNPLSKEQKALQDGLLQGIPAAI